MYIRRQDVLKPAWGNTKNSRETGLANVRALQRPVIVEGTRLARSKLHNSGLRHRKRVIERQDPALEAELAGKPGYDFPQTVNLWPPQTVGLAKGRLPIQGPHGGLC